MNIFTKKNQNSASFKGEEHPEKLQHAEQSRHLLDDDQLLQASGGTELRTTITEISGPPFV